MATNPGVHNVYYTPEGNRQTEVLHIETPGQKKYFRVWLTDDGVVTDWGWTLPKNAHHIYDRTGGYGD